MGSLYVLTLYDAETGSLLRTAIPPGDRLRPDLPAYSRLRLKSEQQLRSEELQCYACVASTQMICFEKRRTPRQGSRHELAGDISFHGTDSEMDDDEAIVSSAINSDGFTNMSNDPQTVDGQSSNLSTYTNSSWDEDPFQMTASSFLQFTIAEEVGCSGDASTPTFSNFANHGFQPSWSCKLSFF